MTAIPKCHSVGKYFSKNKFTTFPRICCHDDWRLFQDDLKLKLDKHVDEQWNINNCMFELKDYNDTILFNVLLIANITEQVIEHVGALHIV